MSSSPLNLHGHGGTADKVFRTLALVAGALVLAILALIAITTTRRAWPAFVHMGLEFFTTEQWAPPQEIFGALSFIYGTIVSSLIAVVLAVPVSVGIALFLTQVAPRWFRRPIVYVLDLLAVVPSVVFGLWGLQVLAPKLVPIYQWIADLFEPIPVLNTIFDDPAQTGKSYFTAGIILAIMITPIVTSLSREVIDTTPTGEKEGALALGATRWEMIRGSVLPHSAGGLVGAVLLGLGRAMGETIAVTLVAGSARGNVNFNLFASGDTMAAAIASLWGESSGLYQSALLALAVTLFAITILINIGANRVVQRSLKHSRGA